MWARSDATAYLTQMTGTLATEAELSSGQTTSAYNQAIDNSLRQLGFAESDLATALVADSSILPYQALLTYYALKQFVFLFAQRIDVTIAGSVNALRSQLYKQVQLLLDAAADECLGYGYTIAKAGVQQMQLGRLNLDYFEPTPAGTEF